MWAATFRFKFCPNCGEPVQNKNVEFISSEYRDPSQRIQEVKEPNIKIQQPVKKNGKNGCLVFVLLFIIVMAFAVILAVIKPEIYQDLDNVKSTSVEDYKQSLLEFDKQSWEDFKTLYASHNNFLEYVSTFSEGNLSSLDFYNTCSDAKDYFQEISMSFNYGSNDEEKTYLRTFESAALSDQQAAEHLMKYADSGKTSQLSKVQENIQNAKNAFIMIASNRGKLLVKAGLTDDEIKNKIETDMEDLD
jgi:hypothetical protein